MAKTKVIGGKTVANLPKRGTATNPGEYDVDTGTFLPHPRPVTVGSESRQDASIEEDAFNRNGQRQSESTVKSY
jgi:hypothetical protein